MQGPALTDDYWLGKKKDLNQRKEIKVKIPIKHLVKLHYLKISRGQEISTSVVEALSEYFAREGFRPTVEAREPVAAGAT